MQVDPVSAPSFSPPVPETLSTPSQQSATQFAALLRAQMDRMMASAAFGGNGRHGRHGWHGGGGGAGRICSAAAGCRG